MWLNIVFIDEVGETLQNYIWWNHVLYLFNYAILRLQLLALLISQLPFIWPKKAAHFTVKQLLRNVKNWQLKKLGQVTVPICLAHGKHHQLDLSHLQLDGLQSIQLHSNGAHHCLKLQPWWAKCVNKNSIGKQLELGHWRQHEAGIPKGRPARIKTSCTKIHGNLKNHTPLACRDRIHSSTWQLTMSTNHPFEPTGQPYAKCSKGVFTIPKTCRIWPIFRSFCTTFILAVGSLAQLRRKDPPKLPLVQQLGWTSLTSLKWRCKSGKIRGNNKMVTPYGSEKMDQGLLISKKFEEGILWWLWYSPNP